MPILVSSSALDLTTSALSYQYLVAEIHLACPFNGREAGTRLSPARKPDPERVLASGDLVGELGHQELLELVVGPCAQQGSYQPASGSTGNDAREQVGIEKGADDAKAECQLGLNRMMTSRVSRS